MDDEKLVEWSKIPYSVVDCPEHRALALEMAKESIVLLQNRNNILPLAKNAKIAVMGPNANDSVMQWANYNGTPRRTITLLGGIKEKVGNVTYAKHAIGSLTPLTNRNSTGSTLPTTNGVWLPLITITPN